MLGMVPHLSDVERLLNECDISSFMENYYSMQQKNRAIDRINSYNTTLMALGRVEPLEVKRWLALQEQQLTIDSEKIRQFKINEQKVMDRPINAGRLGV